MMAFVFFPSLLIGTLLRVFVQAVLYISALDRSNLICIAFITGSDYTEGVPGNFDLIFFIFI